MNTDRDKLVKEIFADALEKANAAERAAYLTQACGNDAQLRQQVEALLLAHEKAGGFLEEPAAALPGGTIVVPTPLTEKPGDRIGHYKLLQQIGEGGCGVVYMAEQEQPIRRRVALKVIKLGMDTKAVIARFEAERQALALMDHPNIAKVLDAGATETGRPFFVMELVRGIKITEYCDQNNLSTEERLDLFVQICHAIQHAHQKGIIHRDIKPSNILVTLHDGKPLPKIIDFGIAKATSGQELTDKTLFTAFEQFIGTPAYMSPEQAEMSTLDIDTRSDIYALGVLLYELLTGRTPLDQNELMGAGLNEMRRIIREEEPLRPSTRISTLEAADQTALARRRHSEPPQLIHLVRGDLDWIVMKCLEKDRTRRYETANGLAHDVLCHLRSEPVLARPPSRMYRFQKLVRRNKAAFAAVGAVAAALVLGLGLSTWLFLRERTARREAEFRQKLSQATVAVSRNQIGDADQLVAGIPALSPKLEYADLYRTLGDWHATYGRWKQAAERFDVLVQVNQPDDWNITTFDYLCCGPVLLEAGDAAGYERFRELAVGRFTGTTNPVSAERVIKVSLLAPPSAKLLAALAPLAVTSSNSLANKTGRLAVGPNMAAWRCFSLALLEYRRGNYAGVKRWYETSASYQNENDCRSVSFQVVLAMVHYQTGETGQARSELAQARREIEDHFDKLPLRTGVARGGYLADWLFARIWLREATELLPVAEQQQILSRKEADKLQRAEFRQTLSQATVAVQSNKIDQADQLVAGIAAPAPDLEYAGVYRTLGDWHATYGRWKQAEERFEVLIQVSDGVNPTMDYLRYGAALLETGDVASYERFRELAVAQFAGIANPAPAERVIKVSLLTPPGAKLLAELAPLAVTASNALDNAAVGSAAWQCLSLALLEYRRGNYAGVEQWHETSVRFENTNAVWSVEFQVVLAMAHYQMGQAGQARSELAQARQIIEGQFDKVPLDVADTRTGPYWMDWVCARIWLREATALMAENSKH